MKRNPMGIFGRPSSGSAGGIGGSDGRGTARRNLAGWRAIPSECRVAHGALQGSERGQVLGGAAGDEAGAVTEAPDVDRHGSDEAAGHALQQFQGEPGEPEATGHGEQAGRAEA